MSENRDAVGRSGEGGTRHNASDAAAFRPPASSNGRAEIKAHGPSESPNRSPICNRSRARWTPVQINTFVETGCVPPESMEPQDVEGRPVAESKLRRSGRRSRDARLPPPQESAGHVHHRCRANEQGQLLNLAVGVVGSNEYPRTLHS